MRAVGTQHIISMLRTYGTLTKQAVFSTELLCLRHILIKNEELKIKNCCLPSYNVETLRATSHCERMIGHCRDAKFCVSTKYNVIGRGGDVARNVSTNTT